MTKSREKPKENEDHAAIEPHQPGDAQVQMHSVFETILGHDLTKEKKNHVLGR